MGKRLSHGAGALGFLLLWSLVSGCGSDSAKPATPARRELAGLVADLNSSDAALREAAGRELRLGGPGRVEELLARFTSTDPAARRDRGKLVKAFQALGPAASPAIPALTNVLHSDSSPFLAALALAGIGPAGIEPLAGAVASDNDRVSAAAAAALETLDSRAAPALPVLIRLADAHNPFARAAAATAIGRVGTSPKDSVPVLQTLLADPDERVRVKAAGALGEFGPAAATALPELLRLAQGTDAVTREAAAPAVWRIDPQTARRAKLPDPVKSMQSSVGTSR